MRFIMHRSAARFYLLANVFMLGMVANAADFEIVRQQTPRQSDITTHEIRSGNVVLGISDMGGGYINKLYIPGVGDILDKHAARYGRGGQVSIRDHLHGGRYNPTQGGFTDTAGTVCPIERLSQNVLHIPPRPMSLWHGDRKYDFTEWENLAADPYNGDQGNSDQDNIDESNLAGKQETEVTSEFDFTATYSNAKDGIQVVIPAFHFKYELRFVRAPGHAIRQFGRGTPIYNARAEVDDRSRRAPVGNHPSSEASLTGLVLSTMLRGDRSVWAPSVAFSVDNQGQLTPNRLQNALRIPYQTEARTTVYPLIIFSTSANPDQGPAIGLLFPDSHVNRNSIVGRFLLNDAIAYEDTRTSKGMLLVNKARTDRMWLFGARTEHTGLLNRQETPEGVYEAIRGEVYILVATPNEIFSAATSIQRRP